MTKTKEPQFIETTAGQIAAELVRRGIAPDQHVTVAIEPDDWLTEVRQLTRPRVMAQGWSDADIDRIIDEERDDILSNKIFFVDSTITRRFSGVDDHEGTK